MKLPGTDQRVRELDQRLVKASRRVHVLAHLGWPEPVVQGFLEAAPRGAPRYPEVPQASRPSFGEAEAELGAIERDAVGDDPRLEFLARTARSYADTARLLAAVRSPTFVERSIAIYGQPTDPVDGSRQSHLAAAETLLRTTQDLGRVGLLAPDDFCVSAESVRAALQTAFDAFFEGEGPTVVLDANLSAKAAAGAKRVRVRDSTGFTAFDAAQLIEHEGFVHAATALNGSRQPFLTCMQLAAPRTTATQEGLATFAELITRSMDILRLRRLALRTVAIHHALEGADIVETFRFFRGHGYAEDESAHAALRVFRGGTGAGGIAFTKDVVYLSGLFAVRRFLHRAIAEGAPQLIPRLFAGRMTLDDVTRLTPAFEAGTVAAGRFVAPWARALPQLATFLAFGGVAEGLRRDPENEGGDVRLRELDATPGNRGRTQRR